MTDDRRRDPRLLMHTRVEIAGIDKAGLQFAERTRLEDVGDSGCRFSLRNAVHRGAVLGIQPLGHGGEKFPGEYSRLFVVIWVKWRGERWMVGARSVGEDELTDAGSASTKPLFKISTS